MALRKSRPTSIAATSMNRSFAESRHKIVEQTARLALRVESPITNKNGAQISPRPKGTSIGLHPPRHPLFYKGLTEVSPPTAATSCGPALSLKLSICGGSELPKSPADEVQTGGHLKGRGDAGAFARWCPSQLPTIGDVKPSFLVRFEFQPPPRIACGPQAARKHCYPRE